MILLDTCAMVWDALQPERMTSAASQAIDQADEAHSLIISDISLWEIAMLIKKGRIQVATSAAHFINLYLQCRHISVAAISPEIAELSTSLPASISADPADRLIAATAIIHNARLITADQKLRSSPVIETLW